MMNQNSQQQTLTSMLMEAVKAASSTKQMHSDNNNTNSTNNTPLQSFHDQQQNTMNQNTTYSNDTNTNSNYISSVINSANNNGVAMDSNLVMQMMRMMISNDPYLFNSSGATNQQQSMVNSTSTTNLSQLNDNIDSNQMLTMLMNNSMNNSTMSQLNLLFSNFLLNTTSGNQESNIINNSSTDKKLSCTSISPTFEQLVNSPQFFDNGCSTHIFIKKGNTKRKNPSGEHNWYRLLVQHQVSPNNCQEESRFTKHSNNHTKIAHTNKCLINTDCFYYLLFVLPSKLYSVTDLEFQLEEDNTDGKRKKKKTATPSPTTPPIEIKIRGKDISNSTKFKQTVQSPNCSNSSATDIHNSIAVFEIMVARKSAKTKSDSAYNIHVNCKQERLLKLSIDLNDTTGTSIDSTSCTDEEILDLAQQTEEIPSQKKRKKESLLDNDEQEELDLKEEDNSSTRKKSKSSVSKSTQQSVFDMLKQWIIVTVFHDSLNVDLTKFPNFDFPKELSLNENFLLYVDVPTQLSEYHDICFKILDADSKQELSFNGEKWIDTSVVNCCNFNIQASLVSLHVEYSISFRDINHDKPLVFVVALKDKNTGEERIIYNGSPFNIQKQLDSIDELGISTIQCSGFEPLTTEPTTISEIFDEIPILNGDSLFSEMGSPTLSSNFAPPSESDILDDFERFLDM